MRDFRPLGLGSVFDAFLKVIFNKNAMALFGFYALLTVPVLFFLFLGLLNAFTDLYSSLVGQAASAVSDNPLLADFELPPLLVLGMIIYYIFFLLLYNLMSNDLFGFRFLKTPYRLLPSFRAQIRRIPGHLLFLFFQGIYYIILYIILSLIVGIITMLTVSMGISALTIVVIIIAFLLMIVIFTAADVFVVGIIPCYAMDRQGLFRSIGHWLILAVKNYFKLWGSLLLFRVILIAGTYMLYFGLTQTTRSLFTAAGLQKETTLFMFILTPLLYVFIIVFPNQIAGNAFPAVLYCNQKIRHEGWGAELLAREFLEEQSSEGRAG